ncbi:hypothetical protein CQW23_29887 [Capsicum baccatum]|uniref:Calmodulin-binding domain-containing protein n=1 Tax=Capsicum baccatum TaxID=33114 RepID=A0A2G2VC64_CAPBA|nr:hypothetical protein CQW23_29887 [Capsicum baccatum]
MLEEGNKVNEVYQKPSSPQKSVFKDEKEVTIVEQKPSSPPGCMEGGIDEVTMVEQKSLASLVSMLGEGENVTVVEKKLPTPPGSMLVEIEKEAVVNQMPSAPPRSMLGQGKKLNVVDRRPSPKVHSLEPSEIRKKKILLTAKSVHSMKLDSSSEKMPEIEKKMKSSSKILGGVDAGGKKDSVANYRKQIIAPKDQNKMRRDGTNKLKLEMVHEKTLCTPKVKASPKSSSQLQSPPLSNEEDKKEVVNSADSALVKLKFRRGKIVDLQQETNNPRRVTFRWGRHVGESQDNNIRKRIFKEKGVDGDKSNAIPISEKIILRHQDVQEKKDVQGLLNNVIEKTASKLVETGKSKVKALVGAFETVISLLNKPSSVSFLIN